MNTARPAVRVLSAEEWNARLAGLSAHTRALVSDRSAPLYDNDGVQLVLESAPYATRAVAAPAYRTAALSAGGRR